jgi:hypothetical protein
MCLFCVPHDELDRPMDALYVEDPPQGVPQCAYIFIDYSTPLLTLSAFGQTPLWRALCICASTLSVLILWSELTVLIEHPNLSPLGILLQSLYFNNSIPDADTQTVENTSLGAQVLTLLE